MFEELRLADRSEYFDLGKGNLIRVHLVKCSVRKFLCLVSNHHAILDGWSSSILFSAVHDLYVQLTQANLGSNPSPSLMKIDADVGYFRAQETIDAQSSADTEHWKGVLLQVEDEADFKSLTPLPAHLLDLSHLTPYVLKLTNMTNVSLPVGSKFTANTILQFIWHRILRVFLRMRQTVVGTTVSGRSIPTNGIGSSVGLFINTLPLVVDHVELDGMTLSDALENVQGSIWELNLKCAGKLRLLRPNSPAVGRPFETLFIFENFPGPDARGWSKDLGISRFRVYEKLNFPLAFTVQASTDSYQATLLCSNSFDPPVISSLLSSFQFMLAWILDKMASGEGMHVLCSQIPYCAKPSGDNAVLSCRAQPPSATSLTQGFKAVAKSHMDKLALICENRSLTYGQLDLLSDRLARQILKLGGSGVGPNKIVALLLEKSEWTIIGILGVLKTGSAYVPIDPKGPTSRVRQILEDCQPSVLVTYKAGRLALEIGVNLIQICVGEEEVLDVAEVSDVVLPEDGSGDDGHDLAYVIYTSGTSGDGPKGVMIEHHSVINLVESLSPKYFGPGDLGDEIILQLSNYVYDLSALQIWLALLNGHAILLPSDSLLLSPVSLADFMAQHRVTHVSGTPSYLKLVNWAGVTSLRRIVVGGELLTRDAWEAISCSRVKGHKFRFINEYGPTETTVTSSFLEVTEGFTVGIGWPIHNTEFHVMDENLRILPDGAIGELCIGWVGLARSYLNRQELTNEKFVGDPYRVGQKLYRTGDLARRLPSGSFEVLGRNDSQVKIRGQRVDLSEVCHWLKKFRGVIDAVLVMRKVSSEAGAEVLVGYFVASSEISKLALRDWLLENLPSAAVPSVLVEINQIPLGVSGKVDLRALPNVEIGATVKMLPTSETEKQVAAIWRQILNLDESKEVGTGEDFYSVGGDSLLFIQMLQKIYEATGIRLKVIDIYHDKTISKLARAVDKVSCRNQTKTKGKVPESNPSFKLSKHPDFVLYEGIKGIGQRIFLFPPGEGGVSSYLGNLVPLLHPHPLVLFNNFYEFLKSRHGIRIPYEMAAREYLNEIKKLQEVGPYHFVGWSWGGVLAFEIGRQMAQEGNEVGSVVIIDSLFDMKSAIGGRDAERLRLDGDVSYLYNPPMSSALSTIQIVLFKATEVEIKAGGIKNEDEVLDERMYSHYVHKTKANNLEAILPPENSLEVIPIKSTHFNWFTNRDSVEMVAGKIRQMLNSKCFKVGK